MNLPRKKKKKKCQLFTVLRYFPRRHRVNVPRWQAVFIHAFITAVGACPEPPVFLVLHGFNKVLAYFIRSCPGVAMFTEDHFPQLFFIPVVHRILFLIFRCISTVRIKILLFCFSVDGQVMAEFTFSSLFTISFLEEDAKNGLWINTEGNLLSLDWFK